MEKPPLDWPRNIHVLILKSLGINHQNIGLEVICGKEKVGMVDRWFKSLSIDDAAKVAADVEMVIKSKWPEGVCPRGVSEVDLRRVRGATANYLLEYHAHTTPQPRRTFNWGDVERIMDLGGAEIQKGAPGISLLVVDEAQNLPVG